MSTRKTYFGGLCALVVMTCVSGTSVYGAQMFTRNLQTGDSGTDVLQLQVFLNTNIATRVALDGPGSSGNETTYYGALTADAVRRYQELYASEILTPLGLSASTGFFGLKTREHVNMRAGKITGSVKTTQNNQAGGSVSQNTRFSPGKDVSGVSDRPYRNATGGVGTESGDTASSQPEMMTLTIGEMQQASGEGGVVEETSASPATTEGVLQVVQRQNLQNTEGLIEYLENGGYLNELDEDTKDVLKDQIRENASRDMEELIQESIDRNEDISWLFPEKSDDPLTAFVGSLAGMLRPKEASAYALPIFGGPLYYRMFCTASMTWAVLIGYPMPAWLGYTYVQGYAFWQFPFSVYAKGWYVPGVQSCWMYIGVSAIPIPTMGAVSFITGTSMP